MDYLLPRVHICNYSMLVAIVTLVYFFFFMRSRLIFGSCQTFREFDSDSSLRSKGMCGSAIEVNPRDQRRRSEIDRHVCRFLYPDREKADIPFNMAEMLSTQYSVSILSCVSSFLTGGACL